MIGNIIMYLNKRGKLLNKSFRSAGVVARFSDSKKSKESPANINRNLLLNNIKLAYASVTDLVRNPKATWGLVKETANHYWVGSKLLWSEIKIANQILKRVFQGHGMTRRERMQLLRTTSDIFRLVPFAVFVIVPFMEFLLPFALKLFPNMLPSTFQDSLKKEETLKQELQMRLAVAKFMQETLQKMASKKSNTVENDASGAKEVISFIEKARLGEPIGNDTVIRIARLFKDELTLANIARPQLVSMCKYMGLQPFGADAFLRFQLRTKFKGIKEDDRRILWEGIDSLDAMEMRDACSERGMRSYGLTYFKLKNQLSEWLSLSIQKNIPISLLIMSRAFMLTSPSDDAEEILKTSMSSLDSDTINEVVIAVASAGEESTMDIRLRKLDSIQFQQEMIKEERDEKEEALGLFNEGSDFTRPDVFNNKLILSNAIEESVALKADSEKKMELTLQEMRAISDLARGSSVLREKAELAVLQANVEYANIDDLAKQNDKTLNPAFSEGSTSCKLSATNSDSGSLYDVHGDKFDKKDVGIDDKGVVRMKHVVSSMLEKLKTRIDTTEKVLGNKLNLLDQDGDGEISSEELKNAVVTFLKRSNSVNDAEELILALDSNKDGKVSLAELLAFIEKKSDSAEVEMLEAQLRSSVSEKKESS